VKQIGGAEHARGRRVELVPGDVFNAYEEIVSAWRRPSAGRNRILLADAPMPPLKVANWTVAERDYDRMNIGDPTKEVIEILQSTRLFLAVGEVFKDVKRLRALVRAHEYPKRKADFEATWDKKDRNAPEYKKDKKDFRRHFNQLRAEYTSLLGRLQQAEAIERQVNAHADKVDEYGHLEIKTAYYKTRNRRFQPRNLWPTEVSSKEDAERAVIPDAEVFWSDVENEEFPLPNADVTEFFFDEFRKKYGDAAERHDNTIVVRHRPDKFTATTSPRGRWFRVRAQYEADRWWKTIEPDGYWQDDYPGPRRPLAGLDASASMFHLVAVALGWDDAERLLENNDFKTLMASVVDELAKAGKIHPPDATAKQRRNAMGAIAPYSYGASLAGILRKIRGDATKYGTRWGGSKNLQALLAEGRKINQAITIVLKMSKRRCGRPSQRRWEATMRLFSRSTPKFAGSPVGPKRRSNRRSGPQRWPRRAGCAATRRTRFGFSATLLLIEGPWRRPTSITGEPWPSPKNSRCDPSSPAVT
jgi:hypothetical protein